MIVKVHSGPHGKVMVVTDEEILGKKFIERKLQLDLSKEFYKGEKMGDEEIKKLVKECYILHLTGEKSIQLFSELVEKKLIVNGIPHAEIVLVWD